VYGSTRDLPSRVIPKFMMSAFRGEDIALYGGEQVLDFTFIDDTISGIVKAYSASLDGKRELLGEDFHFVTGRGVSVAELAKMIVTIVGSRSKITKTEANDFEVRRFIGDPRKSQESLGYEPRVRLEDGLRILSERIVPSIQAR
jgi:nucleoside-diphosphate-sugar epimerase